MSTKRWTLYLILLTRSVFAIQFGDIPANTVEPLSTWVPPNLTLTINGVTQDLSANRSWTIPDFIGSPSSVHGLVPAVPATVPPCVRFFDETGNWSCTSSGGSTGSAPDNAHYVTTQAESGLTNEFNLGSLSSGLLKQTVSSGVSTPSIAASSDVINLFTGCSGTQYLGADGACHTAAGGGSGGNPTALVGLSPINGVASTFIRSDGAPALDQSIVPTWTGLHNWKISDAINTGITYPISVSHNPSGTPTANSFGTGIGFYGKSDTTNDRLMGEVATEWITATDGSRSSFLSLRAANFSGIGAFARLYRSGYFTNDNGASGDAGSTYINAGSGFRVSSAVPTAGLLLQSDGASYRASNMTWPTSVGAVGNVVTSDGTNFVSSAAPNPAISAGVTLVGNTNYTILTTDSSVYTNANFTAAHQWTLPAASAVSAGKIIYVVDRQETVTPTNPLQIQCAGSDVFFSGQTIFNMTGAGSGYALQSNGSNKWFAYPLSVGYPGTTGFFPITDTNAYQRSLWALPMTTPGVVGKILQSNSATSTNWTSYTLPSSASVSGSNLRWDGTNIISNSVPYGVVTTTVDQTAVTETAHVAYTIAANSPAIGTTYRLTAWGNMDNGTTAITYTPRIRWGGTGGTQLIATPTVVSTTTANTLRTWRAVAEITIRTTGATGTAFCSLTVSNHTASSTGAFATDQSDSTGTGVTIDTTTNKDLDLTWTLSATTGTPHVRTYGGYVEIIN